MPRKGFIDYDTSGKESLFCDAAFLSQITGKEVRKTEECEE